ncbi:MAG: hypothetical protein LC798_19390 [Chloroflexi bacterium]|nr:hypothetical protein [Chloroflexota bacterium]
MAFVATKVRELGPFADVVEFERIVEAAFAVLRPGGVVILTMACEPRPPHSGVDGGPVYPDEFYKNVDPAELEGWLSGFKDVTVETHLERGDLYAVARKP